MEMNITHQFERSSIEPPHVNVLFDAEIGCARVLVPDGASVRHQAVYVQPLQCYGILVLIDGLYVGWHCGERTREPIGFKRASDAVRLCGVRDAAWRSVFSASNGKP